LEPSKLNVTSFPKSSNPDVSQVNFLPLTYSSTIICLLPFNNGGPSVFSVLFVPSPKTVLGETEVPRYLK
jgi:hypothetical protein